MLIREVTLLNHPNRIVNTAHGRVLIGHADSGHNQILCPFFKAYDGPKNAKKRIR